MWAQIKFETNCPLMCNRSITTSNPSTVLQPTRKTVQCQRFFLSSRKQSSGDNAIYRPMTFNSCLPVRQKSLLIENIQVNFSPRQLLCRPFKLFFGLFTFCKQPKQCLKNRESMHWHSRCGRKKSFLHVDAAKKKEESRTVS